MKRLNALYLFLDDIRRVENIKVLNSQFDSVVVSKSVNHAIQKVNEAIANGVREIWFDLDHDLGEYASDGGDGIELVKYLVENFHNKKVDFRFHFHSMNPVGVHNMRNTVYKYWIEF